MKDLTAKLIAVKYLTPHKNDFWKWSDNGEAAVWIDGPTIVFAKELAEILRPQIDRGLPQLNTILLLLAATRENWLRSDEFATAETPRALLTRLLGDAEKPLALLDETLQRLNGVHVLDNDVRLSIDARATLVDFVLENMKHRTMPGEAAEIIAMLDDSVLAIGEGARRKTSLDDRRDLMVNSLAMLKGGLLKISNEALRLRRDTGLDKVPDEPGKEVELPTRETVRAFLKNLKSDPEFGGIASTAQQMMSVLTLPRPISQHDELEQGGVCDIANRGPLDRLLLSELAHDDLTLAVRVAVNEAMYLRRESPPRITERRRVVVVDSGLQMWGVPRALATSFALALAAGNGPGHEFHAFRAESNQLTPIDLAGRDGIVEHLKALQPELHVGQSLPELERLFEQFDGAFDGAFDGETDIVLVTSEDAMHDEEFRDSLIAFSRRPIFVGTMAREGHVCLYELSATGSKLLKRIQVDLKTIFADRPPISKNRAGDMPAIFGVKPFPLRLPYKSVKENCWLIGNHGIMIFTRDHRLLYFDDKTSGGIQISDRIRPGRVWWTSREPIEGKWLAVVGNGTRFRLIAVDESYSRCEKIELSLDSIPRGFCSHMNALFSVHANSIAIHDIATGEQTETIRIPEGAPWIGGRYFQSITREFVLCRNANSETFMQLSSGENEIDGRLLTIVDCVHSDEKVGITQSGDLYFFATGEQISIEHKLGPRVEIAEVWRDGSHVVLQRPNAKGEGNDFYAFVDLNARTVKSSLRRKPTEVNFALPQFVSDRTVRNRFNRISIFEDGTIALTSRNQLRLDIVCDMNGIRLRENHDLSKTHSALSFQSVESPEGTGYRLLVARWNDGSSAWIDSRGLLHLKSSNQEIPEVSLVLSDKNSGGWCSDGSPFGLNYFVGISNVSNSTVFEKSITAFAEHVIKSC